MPDGLSGEEQAIYFSKVRNFFDSYACSRVMERRKKMSEHLTDTNVGNIEYIRKADAIDEVNHALDRETILFSFVRKVAISALKKLPSADVVQVVHGHWIDVGSLSCRCDQCGCKSNKETRFCPNCGAKMDGERKG